MPKIHHKSNSPLAQQNAMRYGKEFEGCCTLSDYNFQRKFGPHFTLFATSQILKAVGELADTIPNVNLKIENENRQLDQ